MYKIEKAVPIPENIPSANEKYPLKELGVGDSFFVPQTNAAKAKSLRNGMAGRAKKLGIKIVSMADDTGVRFWRTA